MKALQSAFTVAALAVFAGTSLLCGPRSQAVGQGKPPATVPTGEIYFQVEGNLAVMNPDGTGKTLLSSDVPVDSEPSYGIYDGNRWFVAATEVSGESLPDGQPRRLLEVVREDGAAATTIVDDPALWLNRGRFAWSKDDAWISVAGYRWDLSVEPPRVVEAGLYLVPIGFDAAGPFALASPMLVVEGDVFVDADLLPTISTHDWSPDSTRIVFQGRDVERRANDIYTVDLITGQVSLLALGAEQPDWSPAGGRIAFVSWENAPGGSQSRIESINAEDTDESTRRTLVQIKNLQGWTVRDLRRPRWSPDGNHLVYVFTEWGGGFFGNVYRVTADGRDPLNLTDDTELVATLGDWR